MPFPAHNLLPHQSFKPGLHQLNLHRRRVPPVRQTDLFRFIFKGGLNDTCRPPPTPLARECNVFMLPDAS